MARPSRGAGGARTAAQRAGGRGGDCASGPPRWTPDDGTTRRAAASAAQDDRPGRSVVLGATQLGGLARLAPAVMLRQESLAQADRRRGDLDQLVAGDELD